MDAYNTKTKKMHFVNVVEDFQCQYFGCPAHISSHLIVQTTLSRAGMELSSDVNYRTIMRCIEFSKLSPDINPSVAKDDVVNIVCFTLCNRASS